MIGTPSPLDGFQNTVCGPPGKHLHESAEVDVNIAGLLILRRLDKSELLGWLPKADWESNLLSICLLWTLGKLNNGVGYTGSVINTPITSGDLEEVEQPILGTTRRVSDSPTHPLSST